MASIAKPGTAALGISHPQVIRRPIRASSARCQISEGPQPNGKRNAYVVNALSVPLLGALATAMMVSSNSFRVFPASCS